MPEPAKTLPPVTADALDDAISMLGAAAPEPGLLTPAQVIAAEEAGQRIIPAPAPVNLNLPPEGGEKPAETQPPQVLPEGVDLDALQAKIDSGEALTEDEQKALEVINAEPVTPAPQPAPAAPVAPAQGEKTYNIGGKLYTRQQIEAQYRAAAKIGNLQMAPEAMEANLDFYVKAQNRSEAHRVTAERQKQVAAETKQLEADRARLQVEKARIDANKSALARDKAKLTKMRESLKRSAEAPVTENDLYDESTGRPDPKKQFEYQEKLRAQRDLQALDEQEQEIASQEMTMRADEVRTIAEEFQIAHPQYRTSEPLQVVARKMKEGQSVSPEDEVKVLHFIDMWNTASTLKLSVDKVYASRKAANAVLPEVAAQPTIPGQPGLSLDKNTWAAKIANYRARVKAAPASLGGGIAGGPRGTQGQQTTARQLIENDKRVLAESEGSDEFAAGGVYK